MAVSELILRRRDEAMKAFKESFPAPAFDVRIRSPRRKGGDREFLLNQAGKTVAGVHVKRDSYKMYLADELVKKSYINYDQLNGGKFYEFNSVEDCIREIKATMG